MSFWIVSSPINVIAVFATVREVRLCWINMYPCKSKSVYLLAIFQKEDQFEITCIHVSGTIHFSVCISHNFSCDSIRQRCPCDFALFTRDALAISLYSPEMPRRAPYTGCHKLQLSFLKKNTICFLIYRLISN